MSLLENQIEAILFYTPEPMRISELARLLERTKESIEEAAEALARSLGERGIRLVRAEDELSLATSPETADILAKLSEEEERPLSKGALEVLAIIAYEGPVGSADIDSVRGVNSQSALRQLLMRGLVSRERKSDTAAYEYSVTRELFAHLGITGAAELPEYPELAAFLERERTGKEPLTPR